MPIYLKMPHSNKVGVLDFQA